MTKVNGKFKSIFHMNSKAQNSFQWHGPFRLVLMGQPEDHRVDSHI